MYVKGKNRHFGRNRQHCRLQNGKCSKYAGENGM